MQDSWAKSPLELTPTIGLSMEGRSPEVPDKVDGSISITLLTAGTSNEMVADVVVVDVAVIGATGEGVGGLQRKSL